MWDWLFGSRWRDPHQYLPHDPSYDLKKHLAYVQELHAKYPLNSEDKCWKHAADLTWRISDRTSDLRTELFSTIIALLKDEDIYCFDKPTREWAPYLRGIQAKLTESHTDTFDFLERFFQDFLEQCPPAIYEPASNVTLPLYELIDIKCLAMGIIVELAPQLSRLQTTLTKNLKRASGYPPDEPLGDRPKLVFPDDSDETPARIIDLYLADTPFVDLLNVPVSFLISDQLRPEHTLVVAGAGGGKTQYIQNDIFNLLQRDNPPGMVIIDSQGQMLKKLEWLECFATRLKDRLILIDPETDSPALNMFAVPSRVTNSEAMLAQAGKTMQLIFGAFQQEMTGQQRTAFEYVTNLMFRMPEATIVTLLELMEDKGQKTRSGILPSPRFAEYIDKLGTLDRNFFENQFYSGSLNATRQQVAARLYGLLRVPAFRRMFATLENKLDLFTELNRGAIILINTSKLLLGDAATIFGRYAIASTIRAMFERETLLAQPPLSLLYIDEAVDYFGDGTLAELLTQTRKYNLGALLAFQSAAQLGELRQDTLANTSIKLATGVSVHDARTLAPEMRTTPETLLTFGKSHQSADFACYLRNETPRAVTLTIPFLTIENAPRMTKEQHAEMRRTNKARVEASDPQLETKAAPPPNQVSAPLPIKAQPPPIADEPKKPTLPQRW